jgi:hypothetical protein
VAKGRARRRRRRSGSSGGHCRLGTRASMALGEARARAPRPLPPARRGATDAGARAARGQKNQGARAAPSLRSLAGSVIDWWGGRRARMRKRERSAGQSERGRGNRRESFGFFVTRAAREEARGYLL